MLTLAIGDAFAVLYELDSELPVDDALAILESLASDPNKHKVEALCMYVCKHVS